MIPITGRMVRAAIKLGDIPVGDLCESAGITRGTLSRLYQFHDKQVVCQTNTLHGLISALAKHNVMFVDRGVRFITRVI